MPRCTVWTSSSRSRGERRRSSDSRGSSWWTKGIGWSISPTRPFKCIPNSLLMEGYRFERRSTACSFARTSRRPLRACVCFRIALKPCGLASMYGFVSSPHQIALNQWHWLRGIRIYNYNKSPLESYRGAKFIRIFINNHSLGVRLLPPSHLERPDLSPESSGSRPLQLLPVHLAGGSGDSLPAAPRPPAVQLRAGRRLLGPGLSLSHASLRVAAQDPAAVDVGRQVVHWTGPHRTAGPQRSAVSRRCEQSGRLTLLFIQVFAFPSSVNEIKRKHEKLDPRTVDKLFRSDKAPRTGHSQCWLAPVCFRGASGERTGITNCIFILFDKPVIIGCIKVVIVSLLFPSFGTIRKHPFEE